MLADPTAAGFVPQLGAGGTFETSDCRMAVTRLVMQPNLVHTLSLHVCVIDSEHDSCVWAGSITVRVFLGGGGGEGSAALLVSSALSCA